uniref:Zinc finger protein 808 n=1 Tax=Cacopsylla melanoneura TaxID=428564 RepID=A0A8D8U1W3_9HEMI
MEASSSSTSPVQSCSVCPDKFLSNDKLVLHYVINHKYHICEVCTVVTSSYDDMRNHETSTHLPMKCEICCYQISELSELTTHRETTHQLLTCPFCPLTLNTVFELNYHLKRKHFVLIEPLDLDRGLFQNFAMGKWGYLCLLCGKNRETSGFIGHYRGFHRIRVPTLAKILLQANISLSIIGTLGPDDEMKDSLHDTSDEQTRDNCTGDTGNSKVFQQGSAVKSQGASQIQEGHIVANQNAQNQQDSKHRLKQEPNSSYGVNNQSDATNSLPNQSYHQDVFGGNDQKARDDKSYTQEQSSSNTAGTGPGSLLYSMLSGGDQLSGGESTGAAPKNQHSSGVPETDLNTTGGSEHNITPPDNKFSSEIEDDSSDDEQGDMTSGYYTAGDQKPDTGTMMEPRLYEDLDEFEQEVDPNEVECVLTESSDVESETHEDQEEELMTRLYSMTMQGSTGTTAQIKTEDESDTETPAGSLDLLESVPKKVGNYLVVNNLVITNKIGLNQMAASVNGFRCEICHGYFDAREGLKELLRHMRTLHGIKCNRDTRNMNSVFDNFGRIKMTSYPEYCGPIHVCPFCTLRASSKRFLRRHVFKLHGDTWLMDSPSGPLSYTCAYCKRGFWYMRDRDAHERDEHEAAAPTLRCHICVRPFFRKVLVNEHIRLSHPEETRSHGCVSYKCKTCDILLADYAVLEQHVRSEHANNTVYRCSHCDLGLKNMKSLRYHIKMQHGKASQTFECELCGRVTYSLRSLNSHRRLKHDAVHRALFKCRLCPETFETKDERQLHYANDHTNQSPFICQECGKGFASKSGLYGHRQVHKVKDQFSAAQQVQENFFKCQFCGKEFTRRDSYNEHLLIHMGPRHKCPHCAKDFVQRSNLVRHIRIHTGEKPYKCTHCDKTFSDKGACNSHIRVHTGEETCACPFCGQSFSKKQKLKYHVRKHTGEGLLECDICNKTFTNSYALKDHKATHARTAASYTCAECGSAFTENRFLNRHRSVAHSPVPCFACPFCERIFSHQKALRTHVLIHAGVAYLRCAKCEAKFTSRAFLHDHLAEEHAISVNHEFYQASFISLEAEEVGLIMPKFTEEEVLSTSNQQRDEILRDYFNKVIEGKIELATQFEFKLIQRNRKRVDPDKKGLIAKLKQEQRKPRPPPRKRGGKTNRFAVGGEEWGPGYKMGGKHEAGGEEEEGDEEDEEEAGGGHSYNFRANYPRVIMSEDYDYDQDEEEDERGDDFDAPSVYETSVINLSVRNRRTHRHKQEHPKRRRRNPAPEDKLEEDMEEEEEEEGEIKSDESEEEEGKGVKRKRGDDGEEEKQISKKRVSTSDPAVNSTPPPSASSAGSGPNTGVSPLHKSGSVPNLGSIKTVDLGTPIINHAVSADRLPSHEAFAKDICDVINFDNLPDSTGKYKVLRKVVKKVRGFMTKLTNGGAGKS